MTRRRGAWLFVFAGLVTVGAVLGGHVGAGIFGLAMGVWLLLRR